MGRQWPPGVRLHVQCVNCVSTINVLVRQFCHGRTTNTEASVGFDLANGTLMRSIHKGTVMTDTDKHHAPDEPHRSFVVTDFSVREIPGALVAYGLVSAACIVLGLAVESLTTFWQGFVFGIAVAMASFVGLSLVQKIKEKH